MPTDQREVRDLRKLLAETGADPYRVAAEALVMVERLKQELAEYQHPLTTK